MASKPNKTQSTALSVDAFLAGVTPETRRVDAIELCALMARVSGEPPRMWGPAIVGFGTRHYRYESGREDDILKVGFSPRKNAFALYATGSTEDEPLVAALGKIRTGKSCIYVDRLSDIDLAALETLIKRTLSKNTHV